MSNIKYSVMFRYWEVHISIISIINVKYQILGSVSSIIINAVYK